MPTTTDAEGNEVQINEEEPEWSPEEHPTMHDDTYLALCEVDPMGEEEQESDTTLPF